MSGCQKEEDKALIEIKKDDNKISVEFNKEKFEKLDENISENIGKIIDVEVEGKKTD